MATVDDKSLIAEIVVKASMDPNFKRELLENPNKVLAAHGVVIPAGVKIQIHENTPSVQHMVLPVVITPGTHELNESQLDSVAGGKFIISKSSVAIATSTSVAAAATTTVVVQLV